MIDDWQFKIIFDINERLLKLTEKFKDNLDKWKAISHSTPILMMQCMSENKNEAEIREIFDEFFKKYEKRGLR